MKARDAVDKLRMAVTNEDDDAACEEAAAAGGCSCRSRRRDAATAETRPTRESRSCTRSSNIYT